MRKYLDITDQAELRRLLVNRDVALHNLAMLCDKRQQRIEELEKAVMHCAECKSSGEWR